MEAMTQTNKDIDIKLDKMWYLHFNYLKIWRLKRK